MPGTLESLAFRVFCILHRLPLAIVENDIGKPKIRISKSCELLLNVGKSRIPQNTECQKTKAGNILYMIVSENITQKYSFSLGDDSLCVVI